LDRDPLSKKERELVGIESMSQSSSSMPTTPLIPVVDPGPSYSDPPVPSVPDDNEQPRRKVKKSRLTVIPNMDGTYEQLPVDVNVDDVCFSGKNIFLFLSIVHSHFSNSLCLFGNKFILR